MGSNMLRLNVEELRRRIERLDAFRTAGRLHKVGELLACRLRTALGNLCRVRKESGDVMLAEVVAVDSDTASLFPYDRCGQLHTGMLVVDTGCPLRVPVGRGLLGRVLDGLGRPLDGRGPIVQCRWSQLSLAAPDPLTRPPITAPFVTGIRAIDGLITVGRGQRVGLFSGSGVGKSTLLGEIARHADSDLTIEPTSDEKESFVMLPSAGFARRDKWALMPHSTLGRSASLA
ncbi:MAG TPA: hypothetical protein EYP14_06825 [Planctomycetaceae bacterium]|nr:hypothetical protein [Planctomycetaceae bacterium]